MKTIVVDDEELSLRQFELECSQVPEIELAGTFTNPLEALEYARKNPVDFALLDIEMPQMKGIELAQKLRELKPDIIIIFVSAYSEYVIEALKKRFDYYVLKPYSQEDILSALKRARLLSRGQKKAVFLRTFGRFDVFVEERLVKFSNAKSKELLAVCVDHMGGQVSMEEAVDKLWPDKNYDSRVKALYRKAVIDVHKTLDTYGAGSIFCNFRGGCYLDEKEVTCDYFEYLKDGEGSGYVYEQEYMFDYGWAEETNARLQNMKEKSWP